MPATYDSRDIAAYIAQQCRDQGIAYNNTKIQKLLYCAYGILLAKSGERICDEYPRAWDYGPVFPKVFKYIYKGNDIAQYSNRIRDSKLDNDQLLKAVDQTIDTFGQYRATQLSAWTHKKGSPWYRAVNGDNANEAAGLYGFIPDDFIRDYFCERVLPYVERQER